MLTDIRTDGHTDKPSYKDARTHLKYEDKEEKRNRLLVAITFLDASSQLYKRVCPTVRLSVRMSVNIHENPPRSA